MKCWKSTRLKGVKKEDLESCYQVGEIFKMGTVILCGLVNCRQSLGRPACIRAMLEVV